MTQRPSRFVIPAGTNLTTDADVLPAFAGEDFLSKKTPLWKSENKETLSGRETRRRLWSYPKWRFGMSHEYLSNRTSGSDLEKLFAFYNAHGGTYKEFLFLDPEDKTAQDEPVGVGNGTASLYQLTRTTTAGGISFTEPVRAFLGNPVVKLNGTPTIAFTVQDYGKILFNSPPANGVIITWSGTFFFVCRFEDDELDISQFASRFWSQGDLSFTSIKP